MGYPKIDFLYLSEDDMIAAGVKDMKSCVEAMEEMFKLMKVGDYRMGGANGNSHGSMVMFPEKSPFPEMPVDGPDRRFMAMPAYLGGKFDMAGMKWYGSNAANKEKGLPRSILMLILNDKDTGAPLAFMSANILSAYRTGAVPGVGFKYFAGEDAKTIGKDDVIARIHEAAKYVPLDRLYLSPQCGFASCEIGNKLTEDEQWAKLALVKEIAEEVWGK